MALISRVASLLLVAALLPACDSSAPAETTPEVTSEPASVLLPLAVGNTWTFRAVERAYADDGVTVIRTDTAAAPAVLSVTATEVVAGETWYRASATNALRPFFDGVAFANRSDGVYSRRDGRATRIYAYPAPAGTQFGRSFWSADYDHPDRLANDSDVTLKVTDIQVSVGDAPYAGYLFTGVARRFWYTNGQSVSVDPLTPPFNDLLVPNVGFARYENGYFGQASPNVTRLVNRVSFSLQSFTLAPRPA